MMARTMRRGWLVAVAAMLVTAPALLAQVPPGAAQAAQAAQAAAAGAAAAGAAGGAGGPRGAGGSAMVLDAANNSLIIRTTPRNHRRIADLIRKVAAGKLAGEKQETRVFSLRNLSPEQLFRILEFQRPTFQRSQTLVFPETADGQAAGAAVAGR